MSGFTDKLIKDLDQSEKDAKRAGISRLGVLKETIEDMESSPVFMIYLIFILLTSLFCYTTYDLVTSYYRIPQLEEGMFQIFDVRGVSVKELSQNDHTLSGVLEDVEIGFVELGEMIQQDGMVYYSRRPSTRFFTIDEHWDVVYYYVNDRLDSAYSKRRGDIWFSPISGIFLLGMVNLVYKRYKIKYKEMVGL